MHFSTKNILKNNSNHTLKQTLKLKKKRNLMSVYKCISSKSYLKILKKQRYFFNLLK